MCCSSWLTRSGAGSVGGLLVAVTVGVALAVRVAVTLRVGVPLWLAGAVVVVAVLDGASLAEALPLVLSEAPTLSVAVPPAVSLGLSVIGSLVPPVGADVTSVAEIPDWPRPAVPLVQLTPPTTMAATATGASHLARMGIIVAHNCTLGAPTAPTPRSVSQEDGASNLPAQASRSKASASIAASDPARPMRLTPTGSAPTLPAGTVMVG
jgi:hypothetical protein